MHHFQKYIDKHQIELEAELLRLDKTHKLFVVIPCFQEPNLMATLHSLNECIKPKEDILVFILINSSENSNSEALEQNQSTISELDHFSKNDLNFDLSWIHLTNIAEKKAGVGYARKYAMDQIIAYCNYKEIQDGIIASLDADSLVDSNYFVEIETLFKNKPKLEGCSIYFEHPIEGKEFSNEIYEAIIEYELHLRYYKNAIDYTGFSNYFYTIGSSFAVSTNAYVKYGGMSQNKAGEDFYFLSKLFPNKQFAELNTTRVIPSSRTSDRVPFGTGPMIRELSSQTIISFQTYNFGAFKLLKGFFLQIESFYTKDKNQLKKLIAAQKKEIFPFLLEQKLAENILEIYENVGSLDAFIKRFFNWFNAFKILKFLNYMHQHKFEKESVKNETIKLLQCLGFENLPENSCDLLKILRELDRAK